MGFIEGPLSCSYFNASATSSVKLLLHTFRPFRVGPAIAAGPHHVPRGSHMHLGILILFKYGEANRSGDDCILKIVLNLYSFQEKAGGGGGVVHIIPCRVIQGSTRVDQEAEEIKASMAQSLYCISCVEDKTGTVNRLGLASLNNCSGLQVWG